MAINLANNNSLANITALPSGAGGGAMTTYRQALRDLPNGKDTVSKCENAVFPTKP
jgi:hypothetical protein